MTRMKETTKRKFEEVRKLFSGKGVLVAFSGGVDSTALANLAKENADRVLLVTMDIATMPRSELMEAKQLSKELGLEQNIVNFDWLEHKELARNLESRCYHCKMALAKLWVKIAKDKGLDLVVDGSNADDVIALRPGAKALIATGVVSPFIDAGITKAEIREYAGARGLPVEHKPPIACLATRFPYGINITKQMLNMVELMEEKARELFEVQCIRARYHGELVRIEVGRDERHKIFDVEKLDQLQEIAREVGFNYAAIDVFGYRTGAMDIRTL